jgi:Xaa-Pro aminopeptidase
MISREEYQARREKVLQLLKDLTEVDNLKPVFLLKSGSEKVFSNDVHYPFRANSDFYYLTGFQEPDSALVLDPRSLHPFTLYVRPRDPEKEIWDGFREGIEGAKKNYHADKVKNVIDLESDYPEETALLDFLSVVHGTRNDPSHQGSKRKSDEPIMTKNFKATFDFVHSLRSIKSSAELELMRKSNQISMQAHRLVTEILTPGIHEYEIEAHLNCVFRAQGARGWSYPAIVASGINSCTLHYTSNDKRIDKNDLVLVDAGCEYQYYASDITRVYPASGHFTKEQQDVYDIVAEAQRQAIASVSPGVSFQETHDIACKIISEGLAGLRYIKDKHNPDELKKYYMHGTGHSLGLDVHDCGVDRKVSKYIPGMVTTIEPAIYIRDKAIGIRLENNVLVTKDGHEDFTAALPV